MKVLISILKGYIYRLLNFFGRKRLKPSGNSIVVSLTTYPPRFHLVHLTIESIFRQQITPDVVHLWLSKEDFPDQKLTEGLERLVKRGLKVSFVDKNIRSYKKLIYSLTEYPDAIIVTADDDVFYPSYWIKRFLVFHAKYPTDVLCYRAHYLELENENNVIPYNSCKERTGTDASYNLIATGVCGILYPPKSLHSCVLDESKFMRLAPFADDVWFKSCSILQGVKTRRVCKKNIHFHKIRKSQEHSLRQQNVVENGNDEQIKQVFTAFNIYSLLEK